MSGPSRSGIDDLRPVGPKLRSLREPDLGQELLKLFRDCHWFDSFQVRRYRIHSTQKNRRRRFTATTRYIAKQFRRALLPKLSL
jgi:hypothetical protein